MGTRPHSKANRAFRSYAKTKLEPSTSGLPECSKDKAQAACLHSGTFSSKVPSITPDGVSWPEFVTRQNPDLATVPELDVPFYPYTQQLKERAKKQLQDLEAADETPSSYYYDRN
ncbi:hypothetical protein GYMLUDRAFT_258755 [Collybiopsis luxurians FD-317 M1]|nr:hypothetical protein GYMLUDRAFT_258755 [Collybiopsis luxurians FD-317 M1]